VKAIFLLLAILLASVLQAQHRFSAIIVSEKGPLAGATIRWVETAQSFLSDSAGSVTISNIPAGKQAFKITHVGFEEKNFELTFPLASEQAVEIELEEAEEEEEEVVITATRTSRTITSTPTRVEVISGEELEEKGNMKPGDIRMLLNESTGIQTQQTSATSYNAGIRIQGLDGRYTQILRDGLPLYAGFAGGLSILQIAPLDLQQVEVIKGSASTLYGGGAIAGLVNLVSKVPTSKREISFMANATSAGGLDLSSFYRQKFGSIGVTVFGSRNSNAPFDPAGIGLTAIPKFERYTINPRLFFYGEKTTGNVGVNYTTEDRTGGNVQYIKNGTPGYFERNKTKRFTSQAALSHAFNDNLDLNFKNSYTLFNRSVALPAYLFSGVQNASYSELNLNYRRKNLQWIGGLNLLTDAFDEDVQTGRPMTAATAIQPLVLLCKIPGRQARSLPLKQGLRSDYTAPFGWVVLPRLSALFRFSPGWTVRAGGGAGYKAPSIFNEEAERIQFRDISPFNEEASVYERSVGGNVDINFRRNFGDLGFSINHLFFYTRLRHPFLLTQSMAGEIILPTWMLPSAPKEQRPM
jgi:outer membrane receptor for ferrienterochelin and colicins